MPRRLAISAAILATATALVALPTSLAAAKKPAAGPKIARCEKLKKKAAKRRCRKQNKANRIAFNQIKNSKFVGTRGDGLGVEETFCANGKLESIDQGPEGTGRSTARRWWVKDAKVRKGGKWINAVVASTEGFEVGYQKRGKQWWVVIASLGRYLEPGKVTKTNAAKECRTLEV